MSEFFLNDDDVINMEAAANFTKTSTSKLRDVKQAFMSDWLKNLSNWITKGVPCQVLLVDKVGWHQGRMRLRFEFIPDDPEALIDKPTAKDKSDSPLDDLRTDLNI